MLTKERKEELVEIEDEYYQWINRYEEGTLERYEEECALQDWIDSLTDEEVDYLNYAYEQFVRSICQIIKDTEKVIERNKLLREKGFNAVIDNFQR